MARPVHRGALLTRGGLSGRVYVVTKWRNIGDDGAIEAVEKFDVTDQYDALKADDAESPADDYADDETSDSQPHRAKEPS